MAHIEQAVKSQKLNNISSHLKLLIVAYFYFSGNFEKKNINAGDLNLNLIHINIDISGDSIAKGIAVKKNYTSTQVTGSTLFKNLVKSAFSII